MVLRMHDNDWHGACNGTVRSRGCDARKSSPAPLHQFNASFYHYLLRKRGPYMQRRNFIRTTLAATLAAAGLTMMHAAQAADTIKVGVLHSLSGTMAISETVLKDVTLMAIDEINAKGGVMGKKLEPVVVDPASNWPLF